MTNPPESFRCVQTLETGVFEAANAKADANYVVLRGGLRWRGFSLTVEHARLLRDWLNSVLPDETTVHDIPLQKPCVEWPDVAAAIHALYDEPREGHRGCGEIALAAAKEIERLRPAVEPTRKRLRDSDAAFNLGVLPTEQPPPPHPGPSIEKAFTNSPRRVEPKAVPPESEHVPSPAPGDGGTLIGHGGTAQKSALTGWRCVECGHENPTGVTVCQNSMAFQYSPVNGKGDA